MNFAEYVQDVSKRFADIRHYQRIIVALTETDRIMKEIDQIKFLPGDEK